jgi:hypothetical protein
MIFPVWLADQLQEEAEESGRDAVVDYPTKNGDIGEASTTKDTGNRSARKDFAR